MLLFYLIPKHRKKEALEQLVVELLSTLKVVLCATGGVLFKSLA